MSTITGRVTEDDARAVLDIIEAEFGPGAKIDMNFDWFGNGPRPAIVWEEGPYDWAIEAIGPLFEAQLEVWCEPGTGWFLSIYPYD